MSKDLKEIVQKISKDEILLPDFQRGFTWTEEERQKGIIASVLAKLPIGSILLLESKPDEYAAHAIGRREKKIIPGKNSEKVRFLLDGQQRLTVLSNVFSNVIYEEYLSFPYAESLKRRFFLKIPYWQDVYENQTTDYFGLSKLDFELHGEPPVPDFLSHEIQECIVCKSFKRNDGASYNPEAIQKGKDGSENKLMDDCTSSSGNGYLIPFYLFIHTRKTSSNQKNLLGKIQNAIKTKIVNEMNHYYNEASEEERKDIWNNILGQDDSLPESLEKSDELENAVSAWMMSVFEYIRSCIENMELNQVDVKAENRVRAIDIYEQLNMGGVSLSTFDLVVAKASIELKDNLYEELIACITQDREYSEELFPENLKKDAVKFFRENNASVRMDCIVSKNEIEKVYIETFLNVLSLYSNNIEMESSAVSLSHTKRDAILKLSAKQIAENYQKVCTALDRACFFLKLRCGVRKITELNYKLIFTVLGFVFMNDAYFASQEIHNCLEAWYWCVLFSGEYDKDQNKNMERHIKELLKTFCSKEESRFHWLIALKDQRVFAEQNFSEESFLLLENCRDTNQVPKKVMRLFICQYLLSQTYPGLFHDETIHNFTEQIKKFEQHHIIPLGSVTNLKESASELRKNDMHILNSPLNFIYISKQDNIDISDKTIRQYQKEIRVEAYAKLSLQCFKNLPEPQDMTGEEIKQCLKDRFNKIKGDVKDEINWLIKNSSFI